MSIKLLKIASIFLKRVAGSQATSSQREEGGERQRTSSSLLQVGPGTLFKLHLRKGLDLGWGLSQKPLSIVEAETEPP